MCFCPDSVGTDGPKEVKATQSPNRVKEKDFVTLTCSAKGSPDVSFQWFKDNGNIYKNSAELNFTSIKASDHGSYYCTALNTYGTVKSNTLNINVTCKYSFIFGKTYSTIGRMSIQFSVVGLEFVSTF